jgi:predicted N-acetyltransferase YhbS
VLISSALHFCAFVGFMTANRATCRRSDQSMMSGEMARSTAHHSTFYAAFGFRRRRCCQDKENGGASNERFHFSLQS